MGFFAHYLIKLGKSCVYIRIKENITDSAGEEAENCPADEGKFQKEDVEFFVVGHLFGNFEGTFCFNVRVFRKDIGNHIILVRFDDSGDYEKKTPKENLKIHNEKGFYGVKISSVFECPEKAVETGTENTVFHEEAVGAHNNGISYENSADYGNESDDEHEHGNGRTDFRVFVKCVKIFLIFGYERGKA